MSESIMKRAIANNKITVEILDLRNFTTLAHNQVDDYQFGGGKGMVLMCEPVVNAINSVKTKDSHIILTSPQGKTWNQTIARSFQKQYQHLIIVCGHYEGFDARILNYVDEEISVGDYVLTGGELASLIMLDSITRVVDGVIKQESHEQESFEDGLLDYDVYTKPLDYDGHLVPEVLTSGHHKNIEIFRETSRIKNTYQKRPDLIQENKLNEMQINILKKVKGE
jgi:tRNA (guanine37-N1)-methyltransferase